MAQQFFIQIYKYHITCISFLRFFNYSYMTTLFVSLKEKKAKMILNPKYKIISNVNVPEG